MSDINMEERIAIRDWSLKKNYGSTSNNAKRYESFIKHEVCESDTLQGLALKYGVTTEQIRRANRLWANDSLFLRKSLFIPVTADNVTSPSDVVLLEADDVPTTSHAHDNNNHRAHTNGAGKESRTDEDYSYNDFLVKIDCAIASTKSQVMTAQDNSEFVDTDSIFWPRKGAMSRLKQQQHQQQQQQPATANGTDVPTVMTQGRKVRSSLQRLEKEQDEIFEL